LLTLSANNKSIEDIVRNPLLLALLCQLFALEGQVPPDLTVSKLYQKYWREKVSYSRGEHCYFSELASAKEQLCLRMAKRCFENSQRQLCLSLSRHNLEDFGAPITAAFDDLLSEGVLEYSFKDAEVTFFHQTLLEYVMALCFQREFERLYRERLFSQLRRVTLQQDSNFLLPVLRQFLAIVDDADFDGLIEQLDTTDLMIFGTVAYAVVSRDRPTVLQQLLVDSLELPESYQRELRKAIAIAPRQFIEAIWDTLLEVLGTAEHATAGNTVQMLGTILARWWRVLSSRLDDTLRVIADRPSVNHPNFEDGGDQGQLYGWLLEPCSPLLETESTPDVLWTLTQHIHHFGRGTCQALFHVYAASNIPMDAQRQLLEQLLVEPVSRYPEVRQALTDFVTALLPQHLEAEEFPLGNTWSEVLHRSCPKGWDRVQTMAMGRWAATDQHIFDAILHDYLFGEQQRIGRNLKALLESLTHGSGAWLPLYLQQLSAEDIAAMKMKQLASLITTETASTLSLEDHEQLMEWLQPYVLHHASDLCFVLNSLADKLSTARECLEGMVDTLPSKQRREIQTRLWRFYPIEQHPPLETFNKKEQLYLVQMYKQQASGNPTVLARLLEISGSSTKDLATSASKVLLGEDELQVEPMQLLPLLNSRFAEVKTNVLEAINHLVKTSEISEEFILSVGQSFEAETNRTVAQCFCSLATEWFQQQQRVPFDLAEILFDIFVRFAESEPLEGGMGGVFVATVKAMLTFGEPSVHQELLTQMGHQLLTSLSVSSIDNGETEMIRVLGDIHRWNPGFLFGVVAQDCDVLFQQQWIKNISAVIKTIKTVEGPSSVLMDEVMQRYGHHTDIRSFVMEARGG